MILNIVFPLIKSIKFNLRYYQTPLMYAARVGNLSLIECLAKLNADLDAQDDKCWTVIIILDLFLKFNMILLDSISN